MSRAWDDEALLAKWARIADVRAESNRQIEALRAEGQLGSSLQAEVTVKAGPSDAATVLAALGDDLRFVLITSAARVAPLGDAADADEFFVERRGRERAQVRALLALPRRRRRRPGASDDLRPLHRQPVRRRRAAHGRLMAAQARAARSRPGSASPWR